MVARSAIRNLGRELVQELGVSPRVDFTAEQARSALDRELAHFPPQALARARGFARHFLVRLHDEPLRLARGRALGVIDDLRGAIARFADDFLGARLSLAEFLFAFAGCRQALGDFFLPRLDDLDDAGPNE